MPILYREFEKGNMRVLFEQLKNFCVKETIPEAFSKKYPFLKEIFSKEVDVCFSKNDIEELIDLK